MPISILIPIGSFFATIADTHECTLLVNDTEIMPIPIQANLTLADIDICLKNLDDTNINIGLKNNDNCQCAILVSAQDYHHPEGRG